MTVGQPNSISHAPAVTMTVGEVAASSGVAPSAVRFYERYGVIHAARDRGNHRRFDEHAACRIAVAKVAQQVGLTVREIAELFELLPPAPGPGDWEIVGGRLVAEAERRVAGLRQRLGELGSGTRLCELRDEER